MALCVAKIGIIIPIWTAVIFYLNRVCYSCVILSKSSEVFSRSYRDTYNNYGECWIIPVPEDVYLLVEIDNLKFRGNCSRAYLKVTEAVTNITNIFCGHEHDKATFRALNNLTIIYEHNGSDDWYRRSSFALTYKKESIICTRADHFRCSNHHCISRSQVCDRRDDCEDASDENICDRGILAVEGASTIQFMAIKWVKERSVAYGWDKNTHRAVTGLYLAEMDKVPDEKKSEGQLIKELEIRQLELRFLLALLRNSSEPISISELSMFVNALLVTCHNPQQFHGYNLIKILSERVAITKTPCPGAYLTLCSAGWDLSLDDVTHLFELLEKSSDFPFLIDIQAMTIMALSCIRNKYEQYGHLFNDSSIYNETVEKFVESQLPDGSFGNVYTTALITQALIASGQEPNKQWNLTATVQYLKNYFNSESLDFLSVYLVLPLLSSKSLVDVGYVNCSDSYRIQEKDISDITDKHDEKMFIQYSLFIGDEAEVIHTIYLKIPKNSSAYDLMRVAQATDYKYKFLYRYTSGRMYVYQISDIINDPESGKFWLLYTKDNENKTISSHTKSPDKLILKHGEHVVMWYKTALI